MLYFWVYTLFFPWVGGFSSQMSDQITVTAKYNYLTAPSHDSSLPTIGRDTDFLSYSDLLLGIYESLSLNQC
jgi:hypothetical protein